MTPAISLTFDDGPHPRGTPAVLDALDSAGATATFFVVGPLARLHPDLLGRARAAGHTIGLHCDEHVRHTERDRAWVTADTERALSRLQSLGVAPTLWRTPWGVRAAWTEEIAHAHDLTLVGWDVDTHDWRGDDADAMFAATRAQLGDGAIVLAHDGIGPGARREDATQTAEYVALAAEHAVRRGLGLAAL